MIKTSDQPYHPFLETVPERITLFEWYSLFLESRGHHEHESGRNRLIIVILAFAWCSGYALFTSMPTESDMHTLYAIIGYLIFAVALQFCIILDKYSFTARHLVGLFLDPAMIMVIMIISGAASAPFLFVFGWIAVGQGFRFGPRALLIAAFTCCTALMMIFLFSDYYHRSADFMEAFVIGFIVLMVYISRVQASLRNAKEKLAGMAKYDVLSGLPNRRMFMEHLEVGMKGTRRTKRYIACFFLDLDGFKKVNDTYGHNVGDLLIKAVATILKASCRTTDLAARLSGDEFMIVATCEEDHLPTLRLAERVLKGIQSITEIEGKPICVSASIGVVFYREPAGADTVIDPALLIARADAQMYKAKQAGKGQIVVGPLEN